MSKLISFTVTDEIAEKLTQYMAEGDGSVSLLAKRLILGVIEGSSIESTKPAETSEKPAPPKQNKGNEPSGLREEIEQLKAEIAAIKREYATKDLLDCELEIVTQKADEMAEMHEGQIKLLFELYNDHHVIVRKFKELADKELLDQEKIKRIFSEGYGIPDEWLAFYTKLDEQTIIEWRTGKLKKKPLKLNNWVWDKEHQLWYFEPPTVETIARKGFSPKV
jgi:hypothetical protein